MAKPVSDYPQISTRLAVSGRNRHEAQQIAARSENDTDVAIEAISQLEYAAAELEASLPAKSQASGTVVPNLVTDDNSVVSVTIDDPGLYAKGETPTVTFATGTGSTATGTAVMVNRQVSSITVTAAGSYLDSELPITVTIAAPA